MLLDTETLFVAHFHRRYLQIHRFWISNKIRLTRPVYTISPPSFSTELRITFKSSGTILDRPINACRIKRRRDAQHNPVFLTTDRQESGCCRSINSIIPEARQPHPSPWAKNNKRDAGRCIKHGSYLDAPADDEYRKAGAVVRANWDITFRSNGVYVPLKKHHRHQRVKSRRRTAGRRQGYLVIKSDSATASLIIPDAINSIYRAAVASIASRSVTGRLLVLARKFARIETRTLSIWSAETTNQARVIKYWNRDAYTEECGNAQDLS